ncbi:calmodulin [Acrasis kona]|uniref:Calmodulin n=1 Tax=Acrasis kona TaxID=1008807 RepID=A0AAW2ZEP1_9EUKA
MSYESMFGVRHMPNEKLSEEQIYEYKEAFSLLDKDNSGFVSTKDLDTVLRAIGMDLTSRQIQDLVDAGGSAERGGITFQGFLDQLEKLHTNEEVENTIREAFKIYDLDKDQLLSAQDIKHVFNALGERLSEEQINELIRKVDLDNDNKITCDEFAILLLKQI